MCEEGGHGKELYRPLLRGRGPGPCGAQERRADGAAISEQRIRQLRREPDKKEYARMGIPRRQLQGGHRGQHRRAAPEEPRRLHGRAGGGLGPENAAHERGGGRPDACAADRRRIFGPVGGADGGAAGEDHPGVLLVGGHTGVRHGRAGQFLQAATARLPGLPDEWRRIRGVAYVRAGRPALRPACARDGGGPDLQPGRLRPAGSVHGARL